MQILKLHSWNLRDEMKDMNVHISQKLMKESTFEGFVMCRTRIGFHELRKTEWSRNFKRDMLQYCKWRKKQISIFYVNLASLLRHTDCL